MDNKLSVIISRTNNVPIIVGGTATFTIRIKNSSLSGTLYNLNIIISTPDGLTISEINVRTVGITLPTKHILGPYSSAKLLALLNDFCILGNFL